MTTTARAELIGSCFWVSHRVESPKHLSHPLLPSQATSREMDLKWNIWYTNQMHMGCWCLNPRD